MQIRADTPETAFFDEGTLLKTLRCQLNSKCCGNALCYTIVTIINKTTDPVIRLRIMDI